MCHPVGFTLLTGICRFLYHLSLTFIHSLEEGGTPNSVPLCKVAVQCVSGSIFSLLCGSGSDFSLLCGSGSYFFTSARVGIQFLLIRGMIKKCKIIFSCKIFLIFGHQNPGFGFAIRKNAGSGSALNQCRSETLSLLTWLSH